MLVRVVLPEEVGPDIAMRRGLGAEGADSVERVFVIMFGVEGIKC